MDPEEFLAELWGSPPPGVILIWTLPDQKSRWHTRLDGINEETENQSGEDLYTGVGIAAQRPGLRLTTRRRLTEEEVGGLAGVWADIDWEHPAHRKPNLPPSLDQALETLEEARFEPTLLVNSGHGLQAWWLFEKPWLFRNAGDHELGRRAAQWWHHHIKGLYTGRGWTMDSVFNLDRIMRLAGTWNNRDPGEPKPVTVIRNSGRRYSPQEFLDLAPEDFQTSDPPPGRGNGKRQARRNGAKAAGQGGLVLSHDAEPSLLRLEALLKNDHRFRRSWEQDRQDMPDSSPSAYDMSLATIAVQAGWPDQEVANLLVCWRRKHGHDLKLRENYYALTIAKAKRPIEMARAQEQLNETLLQQPEDEAEVLKDNLATLFGVDITRIVKYLGDPPVYYMHTEQGGITLGEIRNIISQQKFRGLVAAATGILPQAVARKVWDQRVQAILMACEEVEVGDASHPVQETLSWLAEYILEKPPREEDEWEKAAEAKQPFVRHGRVHIFMDDLRRWLELATGNQVTSHAMGRRLRLCMARTEQVNVRIGNNRTTRTCWSLPGEMLPAKREESENPENPEKEFPEE